ncbi:MAG: hypothetical protein AAFQ07_08475, partial [Chloroflexota bacterium]
MMNISIEIVPRDLASIENDLKIIKETFYKVNTINIPDILQLELMKYFASQAFLSSDGGISSQ